MTHFLKTITDGLFPEDNFSFEDISVTEDNFSFEDITVTEDNFSFEDIMIVHLL